MPITHDALDVTIQGPPQQCPPAPTSLDMGPDCTGTQCIPPPTMAPYYTGPPLTYPNTDMDLTARLCAFMHNLRRGNP